MRRQQGFTLIELIIVMVMLGVLLTAGAMFFGTMISGLITSRNAAEIGQATQLAMDRIVYELKRAKGQAGGSTVTFKDDATETSITFESTEPALPGTRAIKFIKPINPSPDGPLFLSVNGVDHHLMENVKTFSMVLTEADVDGIAGNEISHIDIKFNVTGYGGTFSIDVSPRTFIRKSTP